MPRKRAAATTSSKPTGSDGRSPKRMKTKRPVRVAQQRKTRKDVNAVSEEKKRTQKKTFSARLKEAEALPLCGSGDYCWSLADGLRHLAKKDKRWKSIIEAHDLPTVFVKSHTSDPNDYFHSLLKSIIHQQLGIEAAKTIENRVMAALKVKHGACATPSLVNGARWSTRVVDGKNKVTLNGSIPGLSGAKARYIQSLAKSFSKGGDLASTRDWSSLPNEDLCEKLTRVKGIGQWSAEMFLIFRMQRPDVYSAGDLILRQGAARFSGKSKDAFRKASKKNFAEASAIAEEWSPYRSLASAYLWRMKDSSD